VVSRRANQNPDTFARTESSHEAVVLPIRESRGLSIFAILRPALGTVGYVAALRHSALAVDPDWKTSDYTHCASNLGQRIKRVFETHAHSDRVSGAAPIREISAGTHYLHPFDGVDLELRQTHRLPFEFLAHGQRISFDGAVVEVLHFPGHTLGHCGLVLNGRYLFSGELLIEGRLCQPDVDAAWELWGGLLYRSLCRVALLPDNLLVLPSRFETGTPFAARTLGEWRETTPVLQEGRPTEAEFLAELKRQQPAGVPEDLRRRILQVNRGLEHLEDASGRLAIDRQLIS
jgi:glyoxylase-like metal-dependent hydrolase (beta-lactamase superfamily II)